MQEYEVQSVRDFVDKILELEKKAVKEVKNRDSSHPLPLHISRLWYRGEPRDYQDSKLTPKALREAVRRKGHEDFKELDPYAVEGVYIYYGTRVYYHKIGDYLRNGDLLEILIFLQHHGAPTRLLDWTLNPLIALYFAVSEETDKPGYVYILNPRLLNHRQPSFGKYSEKLLIPSEDSINTLARLAFIIQDFAILREKETALDIWTEFMTSLAGKVGKKFELLRLAKEVCEAILGRGHKKCEEIERKAADPFKELDHFFKEECDTKFLDIFSTPVAFFPKWSFQRMQRQLSAFTLHGGFSGAAPYGNEHTPTPKRVDEIATDSTLSSIKIPPGDKKQEILKDLYYLGINKHTLYSDDVGEGVKYLKFFLFDEPLGI